MSRFTGKTVAIIGLSIEGIDTLDFFLTQGCRKIICADRRPPQELASVIQTHPDPSILFCLGETYMEQIGTADVIIRTPGMSPRTPELIEMQKQGKEVTSATNIFFECCPATIIGVTGTKGKGTTCTLITEMLKKSGKKAYLGGNVGISLLSKVSVMNSSDWVVFELSSFQLEDMKYSPHIAVVLRITQDHLANFDLHATNFHETREDYVQAKSQIVRHQTSGDIAIVNSGDGTSSGFAALTPAKIYRFTRYGTDADCYVENHTVYLKTGEQIHTVCTAQDILLRGDHNLENIAAATLAAVAAGVTLSDIRETTLQFQGLEHRLEFVRTIHNISYYNDSFSTVPETTIAAVESFEKPKILIVGGSEKKSDFRGMGNTIAHAAVPAIIVIGQMTERIVKALHDAGYQGKIIVGCTSMHDAVVRATEQATPGSVVILSPACASFDMFKNYKERGKQFKYEVAALT